MDDFTTYGTTFKEAKTNSRKVLKICQEYNIYLNSKKYFMMMEEGVVSGHFISSRGIPVDPTKFELINTFPMPKKYKDVRIFLGHVG